MPETKGRKLPQLIPFQKLGGHDQGFLSTSEQFKNSLFEVKRVFWTYDVPENITRGKHAHRCTHELLVAVTGTVRVVVETARGKEEEFILDSPQIGLHVPPLNWIELHFDNGAVMLGISSGDYNRAEYIDSYDEYCSLVYANTAAE